MRCFFFFLTIITINPLKRVIPHQLHQQQLGLWQPINQCCYNLMANKLCKVRFLPYTSFQLLNHSPIHKSLPCLQGFQQQLLQYVFHGLVCLEGIDDQLFN
ncbi:hypothetical protein POPTR_002G152025v4 [Populus trichocarpa]|uniref:Uncharacterized protein n=1 Tax=Populus trichocarpa TaxID=3694 RepID=A0ACC0TF93_POPTR|nr:hypothetical protein POPTR_002G152025v4 [Populus trichocarpa]